MTQSGQWLERGPWRDEVTKVTRQETCSNKHQMSSVSLVLYSAGHNLCLIWPSQQALGDIRAATVISVLQIRSLQLMKFKRPARVPCESAEEQVWTSTTWLHNQCLSSTCHSLHWQPHLSDFSNLDPWGLTSSPFFPPLFPATDVSLHKQKLGTELKKENEREGAGLGC